MMTPLTVEPARLFTLGEARLSGGTGAQLSARRKELVLLTFLVRRSPKPVSREELSAFLWGERDTARAHQSLRQALLDLRRALGAGLEVQPAFAAVRKDAVELDAVAFERDLAEERFESAAERWHGEFLEGMDDVGAVPFRVWLESERVRLRLGLTRALDRLTTEGEERGDWRAAVRWASRRTEIFPLEETAHRRLIQVLRMSGRAGEAESIHSAFVARLKAELETEPSPELSKLTRQLSREVSRPVASRHTVAFFTPDLVGRESAFAELTAAWQEARDGGTSVVLVEGEPGVGKTRLCEEFLGSLAARGEARITLRARAREELATEPLAVASEMLSGLSSARGLSGAAPEALAELRRVAPWVDAQFSGLPREHGSESALHDAVAQVLAAVAEEAPVVMLLDDAPEADAATRDLVIAVARLAPRRVQLLITSARDAAEHNAMVRDLAMLRGVRRLKLPLLTEAHVEAMLGSMIAMPAEERRSLAARLHAETAGNPFYVTELASALADEGWLAPDARGEWRVAATWGGGDLPIPTGVREALLRRLTLLGPVSREIIDAACVFRTAVDAELLGELTDLAAATLAEGLDELIARRMLRHAPTRPGALEFSHELIRRAAVGALDPHRVDELHRKAADALKRRPQSDPTVRAALAYHRRSGRISRSWSWRSRRLWAAGIVVAAGAVLAIPGVRRYVSGGSAPGDRRIGIMILPFRPTVRGAAEWSEALPDLLATALEGTPGLRVADPWAAWRQLRDSPSAAARGPDAQEAEAVARRAGVMWYVLGTLMEQRGRLNVAMRLYRIGDREPRLSLTKEASADSVVELSEQLALPLMAKLVDAIRPANVASIESRATRSLPALKAYLAAKEAMRRGLFDSADVAINHAIALDSSFGLALVEAGLIKSQLAVVRGQGYALMDLAERAFGHSDSLSERSRLRAQALLASVRTEGRKAAALGARLVQLDSTDLIAWAGLSYYHFAYGWQYGATIDDAIAAADRVVRLDSTYVAGLISRAWLALAAARPADIRLQRSRLVRSDTMNAAIRGAILGMDAILTPDAAMQPFLSRAEAAPAPIPFTPVRSLLRSRPQYAESLLARLRTRWSGDPLEAIPTATTLRLMLAQGRGREADSLQHTVGPGLGAPARFTMEELLVAARIAGTVRDSDARESLGALEGLLPIDSALAHQKIRPVWRIGWQIAAYHATYGDTTRARRWGEQLSRLNSEGSRADFPEALRADIQARLAARQGDVRSALPLSRRAYDLWLIHTENITESHPEPAMRFLLARLLRANGQSDSAEAIFQSLVPPTTWLGFYTALASVELAELLEARREYAEAARHYRVALLYWSRGGDEVAALRERAASGLNRVTRASSPGD